MMKKFGFRAALAALLWVLLSVPVWAADVLIPVGRAVGLELEAAGLAVAELDPDLGGNARDAGMQVGDIIIKADGQPVDDAASLQAAVDRSKDRLVLTVLRDGEERNLTVTPVEQDGRKRLGIYVREGIAGVGTVTYYDPESGPGTRCQRPPWKSAPFGSRHRIGSGGGLCKEGPRRSAGAASGCVSKGRGVGGTGKKYPLRGFWYGSSRMERNSSASCGNPGDSYGNGSNFV